MLDSNLEIDDNDWVLEDDSFDSETDAVTETDQLSLFEPENGSLDEEHNSLREWRVRILSIKTRFNSRKVSKPRG